MPKQPSLELKTFVIFYWSSIRGVGVPLLTQAHSLAELLNVQGDKPWTRIELNGEIVATFAAKPEKRKLFKSKRYWIIPLVIVSYAIGTLALMEYCTKL